MTEKRFEVIDGFEAYTDKSIKCIRDTETTEIYSMENTLEASSTCKKLNALHEENNNLKQALWEAEVNYYGERCDNILDYEGWIEDLKKEWDKEYWND